MNLHASSQPSPVAARVAGLARIVRQVCLLREQGDAAQAARLQENELATAVRDLRLAHGPEALAESELHGLFAAEERRVAEAVILSELLIPRLVESWPAGPPARPPGSPRTLPPPPAARAPAPAAGPPAIPDLLDAMLAAERTGRHPPPANPRQS
ncbi:MAG: hypothetical protein HYV75_00995 [Opitutae bacterium]|nr:hypothetical protein [Opitutae bacterium]